MKIQFNKINMVSYFYGLCMDSHLFCPDGVARYTFYLGVGRISSQKVIGYSHGIYATVSTVGKAFQACY